MKTTITSNTHPVDALRHTLLGGKFIVRLSDPEAKPGHRSGYVLDDAGDIIGDASDYIYSGRGYAVHTGPFAGFVPAEDIVIVE